MFFLYGILSALLKNNLDREKDMIREKFSKITKKCSKINVTIFNSNLNRIFGLENIEI